MRHTTLRHSVLRLTLAIATMLWYGVDTQGQFYSTGADPIGISWLRMEGECNGNKWRIETDSAAWRWALIADQTLEAQAERMLSSDFPPMSIKRRGIDVVMHTHAAYSNGLVSWAPRRLEAYTYDTGDDDCIPWVRHLMTHEYRHVLQTQSSIAGFSRFLYGLFGEQATGLVLGVFVPRWYLEGDAVWAETEYTPGGRGRNSDFMQQMRALCTTGNRPSFSQAYFGSYAKRFPDFYKMGYLMVSALSDTLGNEVFGRAVNFAGRKPFTILPFQISLRRQAGMRQMRLFDFAMDQWTARWEAAQAERQVTEAEPIFAETVDYREATHTQPWAGGLVTYATGPDIVGRFEVYDAQGRLVRTITPSERNETRFSVHGDTIYWSERYQHCRWANAIESRVLCADLRTGHKKTLTKGHMDHSPAISPDGSALAYIRTGDDMRHTIRITTLDGAVIYEKSLPTGWQIPEVTWRSDDRIVMIIVNDEGRQMAECDIDDGDWRCLIGPMFRRMINISAGRDGRLYFAMDTGDEYFSDIYSMGESGDIRREVVARDGADTPFLTDSGLMVSLYGPSGYAPSLIKESVNQDTLRWQSAPKSLSIPEDEVADSIRYAKFRHIGPMSVHLKPNLHSWGPVRVDADAQSIAPGIGLSSQNTHGTTFIQLGYDFAPDNDYERIHADVTWDWLWTRLKFGGKWGHTDYKYSTSYTSIIKSEGGDREFNINMSTDDRSHLSHLTAEASIPLTRNSGAWLRAITPSASFDWERATGITYDVTQVETSATPNRKTSYKLTTDDSRYTAATFGLSAHILRRQSVNDIGYRYGVAASLVYDRATHHADYGTMTTMSIRLYAPGIGRHHQISLYAAAQSKQPGAQVATQSGSYWRRMISDRVAAPYGLSRISNKQSALLRATYMLPLVNPDWQWGPVAYIKRINLRAIYDYGIARMWNGSQVTNTSRRWTASGELWAETRWATLPYPANIGCRVTYLPETKNVTTSLLFSVTFQ